MENSCNDSRSGQEKQMEETNRKYYRKALIIHTNLIHLSLQGELQSKSYDPTILAAYFNDFMELSEVGVVDGWDGGQI
jgi:hypothetical protein